MSTSEYYILSHTARGFQRWTLFDTLELSKHIFVCVMFVDNLINVNNDTNWNEIHEHRIERKENNNKIIEHPLHI